MPKGRRVGFTHGAANFCLDECLGDVGPTLWLDTTQSNLTRYFTKYFEPILKNIPRKYWHINRQLHQLKFNEEIIDFRSAEQYDNIEGFGYKRIIINEAGIILKGERGRYIWENAILPMTMDYSDCQIFAGGTPKGKKNKDTTDTKYWELQQIALSDNPLYRTITVPTYKNPYISAEAVKRAIAEIPEGPVRDQEIYGLFVDSMSDIIKAHWFNIKDIFLEGRKCRSWDLAFTTKEANDYSAGALLCENNNKFQIQDVIQTKLAWPDLKKLIMSTAELDGPDVPVIMEEAGQQIGYADDLRSDPRMNDFQVIGQKPEGNKLIRAMKWASRLESGQITLLRGDWNTKFIGECGAFTNDDSHAHDDMIDGVSGGWQYFLPAAATNFINPLRGY